MVLLALCAGVDFKVKFVGVNGKKCKLVRC